MGRGAWLATVHGVRELATPKHVCVCVCVPACACTHTHMLAKSHGWTTYTSHGHPSEWEGLWWITVCYSDFSSGIKDKLPQLMQLPLKGTPQILLIAQFRNGFSWREPPHQKPCFLPGQLYSVIGWHKSVKIWSFYPSCKIFWIVILFSHLLVGSAVASIGSVLQFDFSFCANLPSFIPFHHYWAQDHSLIHLLPLISTLEFIWESNLRHFKITWKRV